MTPSGAWQILEEYLDQHRRELHFSVREALWCAICELQARGVKTNEQQPCGLENRGRSPFQCEQPYRVGDLFFDTDGVLVKITGIHSSGKFFTQTINHFTSADWL